jgi:DnaJ-class molecular chaperone
MTQANATAQQTCSTCNGTGQVQKSIYNTATGQTTTVTETCLDCL